MAAHMYTDEEIQRQLLEELRWDARVRPADIGVAVTDGIVTLTGRVDSCMKTIAVEEAAHRMHGVTAVVNNLEVHLPGSAQPTDVELAAAVVNVLRRDANLPADYLNVTISQGRVTLKGAVSEASQKQEAEQAIRHLAGVTGVTNLIEVRSQTLPADLRTLIEQALIRNAETDAQRITVEVQGNKIILRGTVCSYAERKAAEETAWPAPGVTEVENKIIISLP